MTLSDQGDVTIDVGGESFAGHWQVTGNSITVTYADERRTVTLADRPPPLTEVAKEILGDLVGIHLTRNTAPG